MTDTLWKTQVRAKGNLLTIKKVSNNIYHLSEAGNQWSFSNSVKSGEIYFTYKNVLNSLKAEGYDISSLFIEYYTGSGQFIVSTQIY